MLLLESSKYLEPIFWYKSTERKKELLGWFTSLSNKFILGSKPTLDIIIEQYMRIECNMSSSHFPFERIIHITNSRFELNTFGNSLNDRWYITYDDFYCDNSKSENRKLKLISTHIVLHRHIFIN